MGARLPTTTTTMDAILLLLGAFCNGNGGRWPRRERADDSPEAWRSKAGQAQFGGGERGAPALLSRALSHPKQQLFPLTSWQGAQPRAPSLFPRAKAATPRPTATLGRTGGDRCSGTVLVVSAPSQYSRRLYQALPTLMRTHVTPLCRPLPAAISSGFPPAPSTRRGRRRCECRVPFWLANCCGSLAQAAHCWTLLPLAATECSCHRQCSGCRAIPRTRPPGTNGEASAALPSP